MIESINIQNFRLFDNIQIEDFKRINFLIGDNNSGKTSILEALLLITDLGNVAPLVDINHFRGLPIISENSIYNYFYNFDMNSDVRINANFDNGQCEFTLKKSNNTANQSIYINGIPSNTSSLRSIVEYDIINNNEAKKGSITIDNNGNIGIQQHKQYDNNFPYISDRYYDKSKLIKQISDIKRDKKDSEFIENLRIFDEKINSFDIIIENPKIGAELALGIDSIDKLVPLSMFGDGTKKYLRILATLISNNLNCLMIDEIENGLYFENTKKLLVSLIEFATKKDIQLFITTHSIEVLKYLAEISQENTSLYNDISVINIQKTMNSGYKAYSYDCESFISNIENKNKIRR